MARDFADRYIDMIDAGITGLNPVGQALATIVAPRTTPAVFHCSAGKDRTGVLAAILLALLGVGDDDIADDYALSAEAMVRKDQQWRQLAAEQGLTLPPWVLNPAPRDAMVWFLEGLRARYGSVEAFTARAGFSAASVDKLRQLLLTPGPGNTTTDSPREGSAG